MATSFLVIGDSIVAGFVHGDSILEQTLTDWPADIPALIEGGHIQVVAGGDPAPVDPAPQDAVAPTEG